MNKMKDRIELLSRMTVARGATLNEEQIAKDKMALYVERMSTHRTEKPTPVHVYESVPLEEQKFGMKWETVKRENRRKWGIK